MTPDEARSMLADMIDEAIQHWVHRKQITSVFAKWVRADAMHGPVLLNAGLKTGLLTMEFDKDGACWLRREYM